MSAPERPRRAKCPQCSDMISVDPDTGRFLLHSKCKGSGELPPVQR